VEMRRALHDSGAVDDPVLTAIAFVNDTSLRPTCLRSRSCGVEVRNDDSTF
jgi:hypothetical protein